MTDPANKRRMEIRKRLFEDFDYYASKALKIRTKDGEIVNLKLNEAQKRLLEMVKAQHEAEGKVRVVILKARQMGLSTAVGGYMYWWTSQRPAQKALVVTHHSDSTKALFDMTRRYYDNTPDALKPVTRYSSRKEINFAKLDSGYAVATAGGESVGRGDTVTVAHLSELAFWPKNTAKDILNGILQAIPSRPNTCVFVESTANGVSGEFYNLWRGAVEGTNGFIPVFLPWFIQEEYRETAPEGFERTHEEERLAELHSLDDEQLMFRRRKIAQNGIDLFKQEYPSTPEEAFLTTGRPVFNPEQLSVMEAKAPRSAPTMGLIGDEFKADRRGELTQFVPIAEGQTYYIGADVAMGVRGGDYSVAQILDSNKQQVGIWRGHVHPDYFANVLQALGFFYNTAMIAVESNNHGILTCTRLGKDFAYPNFFTETVYDKLDDKETINLGFRMNTKTKPLVIDQLRASLREEEMKLHDRTTIHELMTFVVTDSGSMEAESGCHDDTVISLAIANHIHEGVFTPVVSTDDFYVTAI
jgi:hypothetical protein